jgi:MFS family permease
MPIDPGLITARLVEASSNARANHKMKYRPILSIVLPFGAGYYLSYVFRTMNAVMADVLVRDLGLGPSQIGLLTAAYFFTFAVMQLPIGIALDRYGPRLVQTVLLCVAAVGAVLFAVGQDMAVLLLARALIGLGVAGGLMAALKAISLWTPAERQPFFNGVVIAMGALGALTATAPIDRLLTVIDWRSIVLLLGIVTAAVALIIRVATPDFDREPPHDNVARAGLLAVYRDPNFWQLAPLSALCIGTAWALHGLWAAPWLTDVAHFDRPDLIRCLVVMSSALCVSAVAFGMLSSWFRRRGLDTRLLFLAIAAAFIGCEFGLAFHAPIAPVAEWGLIAAMGAATVLSYSILSDFFPKHLSGRANSALNVLHIGSAFVLQTAFGLIVNLWQPDKTGHYPERAYQVAILAIVALQVAALVWYVHPLVTWMLRRIPKSINSLVADAAPAREIEANPK